MDDDKCVMITCRGERCKLICTGEDVVCRMHLKKCKGFFAKYKTICDKVWDKRCDANMSPAELDAMIKMGSMCMYSRIKFADECCGRKYDSGHIGALIKMGKLINRCSGVRGDSNAFEYLPQLEAAQDLLKKREAEKKADKFLSNLLLENPQWKDQLEQQKWVQEYKDIIDKVYDSYILKYEDQF